LRDGLVLVLPPPPVQGLGSTAGFKMMIQDRADLGLDTLGGTAFQMMVNGSQTPDLRRCSQPSPRACPKSSWTWTASKPRAWA